MPRLGERDGCVFYIRRTHPWYKSVLYSKHLFASVAIDQTDNDSIQTSGKYVTLIKLDNIMAGRTVAKHLHDLGHRRIAFLSFCEFSPSELIGRRFAGVREFFPETDPDSNFSCQLFDRLPKWWKPLPPEKRNDKLPSPFDLPLAMDRVTAWICISDVMALNAIQVLRARGIGVPRRLSIISFNNSPICHSEGLTTYDLNHFQTGHLAAASLIHRPTTPYGLEKCLRIQGALVIRSTTGFPLQSKI